MPRLVLVATALLTLFACEDESPCDRYADYMCACHPEDDCASFRALANDPSPSVQDQCLISLTDQQDEDATDTGFVCGG